MGEFCIRFGCDCMQNEPMTKRADTKTQARVPAPDRSQVIRLRKGQAQRLGAIGDQFGTTQGQLVSWAVDALLAQVELNGGKLVLPFTLPITGPSRLGASEGVYLNDEPTHQRS